MKRWCLLAALGWLVCGCSAGESGPLERPDFRFPVRDLTWLGFGDDGGVSPIPDPPDLAATAHGSGPPYPIVLVHGMAGFKNIGPLEYYCGVPEALKADGHDVWISKADPINDSEVRGAQVQAFVQQVLAQTGKAKVNLIGHSQGGFDVRFVASALGDRVASVVTIASPMGGDPIADLAVGAGPAANDAINALLNLYGAVMGYTSEAKSQIAQLTSAGANAFFAKHPDDPRVKYFSIAGRSEMQPNGGECESFDAPIFVSRWNFDVDPLNPIFAVPAQMLDGLDPRPLHDGLVTVTSAKHGTFLGCIPADHTDEVHQLFCSPPGAGNHFDAVAFYRELAKWLVVNGF